MKWRQSKFRFLKNCILYSGIFSMTILYSTKISVPAYAEPINESGQAIESQSVQRNYPIIAESIGPLNPLNPEEPVEPIDSLDRKKDAVEQKRSESVEIELIHPKNNLEGIPDGSRAIKIANLDDSNEDRKNKEPQLNQLHLDKNLPLSSEPFPNGKGKKTTEMAYIEEVFSELSGVVFFGVKQR